MTDECSCPEGWFTGMGSWRGTRNPLHTQTCSRYGSVAGPEPTGLVATREDAHAIGWDRPVHPRISGAEAERIMGRL